MNKQRPILSKAESYDQPVKRKSSGGDKKMPYKYDHAKVRVFNKLGTTIARSNELPSSVFPDDKIVTKLTLHPSFLAKTSYPEHILEKYHLKSLGSKEVFIEPEVKITKEQQKVEKSSSSQYFVSGYRKDFEQLLEDIATDSLEEQSKEDIVKFEDISFFDGSDKLAPSIDHKPKGIDLSYEVVLHATYEDQLVIDAFFSYIESISGQVYKDKTRTIKGLTFCFVKINSNLIQQLADFAFVRIVRPIPEIKLSERVKSIPQIENTITNTPLQPHYSGSNHSNIAIFDAGLLPEDYDNEKIRYFDLTGQPSDLTQHFQHGSLVTSAIVYGEADTFLNEAPPVLTVDHYKVYSAVDEYDVLMVDVLDRITRVLSDNRYKFVNISLGPEIPCSDEEPNLWTATLDELAATGDILFVIAVGNNGDDSFDEPFRRIQPPADMLNGMSIGAANSKSEIWKRADYSCIGPGRRPGYIKPDALFFGGDSQKGGEKVQLLSLSSFELKAEYGTSFAAPLVLRQAALIDLYTDGQLDVATIRALLIHSANLDNNEKSECGWGRISNNVSDVLFCSDNKVTFIYQGELKTLSGVRAVIPWPDEMEELKGHAKLSGTACFYTDIDQQHTVSYTRAGLEITFRPHCEKFDINKKTGKKSTHPSTKAFFTKGKTLGSEQTLRSEAHKWETCCSAESDRMNVRSLKKPVVDIKYHTRDEGQSISYYDRKNLKPLRYSLVITIGLEKDFDLYTPIVNQFKNLTPLNIELDAMVTVRGPHS